MGCARDRDSGTVPRRSSGPTSSSARTTRASRTRSPAASRRRCFRRSSDGLPSWLPHSVGPSREVDDRMAKPPPRWMVRMNVALLRAGLRVGSQYLLTAPGRTSGAPRSTPISVVALDGERYVVSAFSDADWVHNVRAAGRASLRRGGHAEAVRLVELPEAEREPVLRAFLQQVPGGVRFFESPEPDAVVFSAGRYPVFRVVAVPDRSADVTSSPQPTDRRWRRAVRRRRHRGRPPPR
jgi:deazaflavin-dependent oxidoreductase (nitroreductase family)